MRNILNILIISFLISSCTNKSKQLNKDELCTILIDMSLSDQKYRGMSEMNSPYFEVLDSLMTANNLTFKEYAELPKEKTLEYGAKAKLIADKKPKVPQHIKDSLMNLQIEIDNRNTENLIDLVKNNGWPIKDGFRCEKVIGPTIIFRHSQEKYWNQIKQLIDKELSENRISEGEHEFINNHLNGRPAFDSTKIIKVN